MKLLLISALLGLSASGFAVAPFEGKGGPIHETIFYAKNGNPDWLVIRPGIQISAADLVRGHKIDLGLTEQDELVEYRTDNDPQGFTHHRYRQYHRGVKVDGGELLIHERGGWVRTLNGKLVRGLDAGVDTRIPAGDAIKTALNHVPAERYMWEVARAEALLKRLEKNPAATYYPKPELVLVDPTQTHNPAKFQPAWSFTVYAEHPQSKKMLFVSALDGSILHEVDLLHDQNEPGTAQTKYSGTKTIITDSVSTGVFRLVESTRGGGIETYNLQESTNPDDAVDFYDDDNHWNNVNPNQDEVATDAHWGAEMTFDYYAQQHSYDGIDGQNMPLISFVHYGQNVSNAFWNGQWAQFGDGDGNTWTALTSLDVVGHEFTHGVTGNTAGLRYQNESGALNESFSDIFGTAIEFWADPDNSDWLIGEDFAKFGGPLRSMVNPKAQGNPDTYKGENWEAGSADNGGVHTNSGVQNHWFCLLAAGGSGKNDKLEEFDITGVGLDVAAAVAFRNLRYYLVELSNYADAREGSLQAAEDLFGFCSDVRIETAKAWRAVGVGTDILDYDINMLNIAGPAPLSCGLTDAEHITVKFRYNGCNADLAAGDKIPMAYQINYGATVWDTLTLTSAVSGGDTVSYAFPATNVFATPGTYLIRCWSGLGADLEPGNNETTLKVESIYDQNVDMGVKAITNLSAGCFLGTQSPGVDIGFFGCDSIPAGKEITVYYNVDGGTPASEKVKLPKTLYRGQTFHHNFSGSLDFSNKGTYYVNAWLEYQPDYLTANDSIKGFRIVNPLPMFKGDTLTFEAGLGSFDSLYAVTARETQLFLSAGAARTGALGMEIIGGDLEQAYKNGEVKEPTKDNVWQSNTNRMFKSKACVCADLTNLSAAELRFDRRQTYSSFFINTVGYNLPYVSSLRVLINNEQLSQTYKPVTHKTDNWTTQKLNLKDYLGQNVEVCFETHTAHSPAIDTMGVGDRVLLDNIAIIGQVVTGTSGVSADAPAWTVMPNPGSGLFTIAYQATETQRLLIDVIDPTGRSIRQLETNVGPGKQLIPVNLEGAATGVYYIRLGSETEKSVRRVVVSR